MKVCRVPGCPTLIPSDAYRGLCPEHRRQRDKARGGRTARGYGHPHQLIRQRWEQRIDAGELVTCWRCGWPITSRDRWHLGHDDTDRSITRGPEHEACNLSAAARASHR